MRICSSIGDGDVEISAVEYDSRKVRRGALFFCISGFKTDGHLYAPQAVAAGAVALMVTHKLDLTCRRYWWTTRAYRWR